MQPQFTKFHGLGNDYLAGGGGLDVFDFEDGIDRIVDFDTERDRLDVSDFVGSFAALLLFASDEGDGVRFDFGANDELKLYGVAIEDLSPDVLV